MEEQKQPPEAAQLPVAAQPPMATQPLAAAQPPMATQPLAAAQLLMAAQPHVAAQHYIVQQSTAPPGYPGMGQVLQPPQQTIEMMPMPQTVPGCPRGLEYLLHLDQVLVHQQVEMLEVLTNIETLNRYVIKNSLGQQCYFAHEESDFFMRNSFGSNRGFIMHIDDNFKQEVIRLERPFKCCAGCCWCATGGSCSHLINIESPPGTVIGKVVQDQSFWTPYYRILNELGQEIFKIKGPCCVCDGGAYSPWDYTFDIYAGVVDGEPVGRISKQYSGVIKELYTRATNFSVTFPVDLDVKMKATLLAATFLIDFVFFENPRSRVQGRGNYR